MTTYRGRGSRTRISRSTASRSSWSSRSRASLMSSPTWTRDALSSSARRYAGKAWRAVEAQHRVSTAKLTDNLDEQERLETLIEAAKPAIPIECRHLHYLLATPFRYGAPYPVGSR